MRMIWEPCSIFSTSLKLIQHQEWIQVPSSVFLSGKVCLSTCLCEFTGRVLYRSRVLQVQWSTGLGVYAVQVQWFTGLVVNSCLGVNRSSGQQVQWSTGLVVYRSSDLQVQRSTGLVVYWSTGLVVYGSSDLRIQ